jgi:purine-binding chemotaxis protein CheW
MQLPSTTARSACLLVRAGSKLCALPLETIDETMRPLPIEPIATAPSFVRGLAVVRGAPLPVIDAAALLGGECAPGRSRFVTLNVGERRLALAVDAVVGIREIDASLCGSLPSLLSAGDASAIEAIGSLDGELLVVLRSARVVPDAVWNAIDGEAAP